MAQQNNDNSGAGAAIGFLALGMVIFGIVIFAVFVFASFVLTIFCLFAWNTPRRLGKVIVQPEDARAYVVRGLWGFSLLPLFVFACQYLFDFVIQPDFWIYIYLAGYAGGSLGIELLMGDETEETAIQPAMRPVPAAQIIPPDRPDMRAIASQVRQHSQGQHGHALQHGQGGHAANGAAPVDPFRFATWDDEEEFR